MKALNPSHAFALTLVDELARCGVRHACLAPGSRSAALAIALVEDDRISLHVCIDERSAAFMGLGIGRATRTPAVVLSTSGTATANFHPAVIEAEASRVPLIVITADRPPELRSTGANQTIDQVKLYGDAVRWFCEVGVPEERPDAPRYWRSVACRAFAEAVGRPAGPVHLNAPMREPLVPTGDGYAFDLSGRPDGSPWTIVSRPRIVPSEDDLDDLAMEVSETERGIVVAGDAAFAPWVAEFAERAGYPLFAEPLSNLRVGGEAITTYDALLRTGWAERHRPDLVIRVGRVAVSKALARFLDAGVRQILIDPDRRWLDPGRTTSWFIHGDPYFALRKVGARGSSTSWAKAWLEAEGTARKAIDEELERTNDPTEPRIARDLATRVPDGSNLVVGSSMPVRDLDSFMPRRGRIEIFGNRGASGIDGFVSTALGIALGTRRPTYVLAGDLTMLHDQNGLLGATERGVDVTFVVLNNDGGGIFSFLPQAEHPQHFEKLFGTPHGIDFEKLAALHGLDYVRLERASGLADALEGCGVRIVEVRTDRAANVELHQRVWTAVEDALP